MTLAPETRGAHTITPPQAPVRDARLPIERYFTKPEVDPYDQIEWEQRTASIEGADGKPVFEQKDVEFPVTWSQNATNVVASKYFRGALKPSGAGSDRTVTREGSVKQLIDRVTNHITEWGQKDGYFASDEEAQTFRAELKYVILNLHLFFNSPVLFNIGIDVKPECSGCFIMSFY
jgi:ribonucleoside-diphosphate reductase alpha chain